MRRFVSVMIAVIGLVSCKGEPGEKGDPGQTGFPSPSQSTTYERTGTVGLGSVFLGRSLESNSAVLVYLESASSVGTFVLLSFDPSTGPWAEVDYTRAHVQFNNCSPIARYKILVIDPD